LLAPYVESDAQFPHGRLEPLHYEALLDPGKGQNAVEQGAIKRPGLPIRTENLVPKARTSFLTPLLHRTTVPPVPRGVKQIRKCF
jgi:hypothetical protein